MLLIAPDSVLVKASTVTTDMHGQDVPAFTDGWAGLGNLQVDSAVRLSGSDSSVWEPVTRASGVLRLPTAAAVKAGDQVEVNGRLWDVTGEILARSPADLITCQHVRVEAGDWWRPE